MSRRIYEEIEAEKRAEQLGPPADSKPKDVYGKGAMTSWEQEKRCAKPSSPS